MGTRRSSDALPTNVNPTVKVVGFKVEGVPQSPSVQPGLLQGSLQHPVAGGGSPDPVIIPPAFPDMMPQTARAAAAAAAADSGPKLHAAVSLPPLSHASQESLRSIASSFAAKTPPPSLARISPTGDDAQAEVPHRAASGPPTTPTSATSRHSAEGIAAATPFEAVQQHLAPHREDETAGSMQPTPKFGLMGGNRGPRARVSPGPNDGRRSDRSDDERPFRTTGFEPSQQASTSAALATPQGSSPRREAPNQPGQERSDAEQQRSSEMDRHRSDAETVAKPAPEAVVKDGRSHIPAVKPEKKALTKVERREIQERQRAEKARAQEAEGKPSGKQQQKATPVKAPPEPLATPKAAAAATVRGKAAKPAPTGSPVQAKSTEMFAHLPPYRGVSIDSVLRESSAAARVHPAVLQLGLRCADGSLSGSNARCRAMLVALRQVILDYVTPQEKVLSRDLTAQLNVAIQFLVECRPLSVPMGNAIKFLKLQVSRVPIDMPLQEARESLAAKITSFVEEKIDYAAKYLVETAQSKVVEGDVVLTFAYSSAVHATLLAAMKAGRRFRVVVADSRPHYEGRRLLSALLAAGIPCTYVLFNALSYVMAEVSKVLLGASAIMRNGTVISRAGGAAVAMAADAHRIPVLVCCETIKLHDRVQLDSITSNELGNPDALADVTGRPELDALQHWRDTPNLELLNLMYDAMPCEYATLIVTEFGAIPPTSVPVILREYQQEPVL